MRGDPNVILVALLEPMLSVKTVATDASRSCSPGESTFTAAEVVQHRSPTMQRNEVSYAGLPLVTVAIEVTLVLPELAVVHGSIKRLR